MPERKGARNRAAVTDEIRAQLNAGTLETATLSEMLVIDFATLMKAVAPRVRTMPASFSITAGGVVTKMREAGELLHAKFGLAGLDRLVAHPADTVRGWAAYLLCADATITLADRLARIQPLADDPHFGVREWAWMAIRPHLATDLANALTLLQPWTLAESANLRRFAVESTRPRGVWCSHITALKDDPTPGQALLDPLHADPTKYVQDSVANWLNDAAKSKPDWVRACCKRWRKQSKSTATERICSRALRTIGEA